MLTPTTRSFRRLAGNQDGTSVVELALVSPFLVLLLTGLIDLSQGISEQFSLKQAVNRGLELVQARPPRAHSEAATVDFSYIQEEAAAAAGVPLEQVIVDVWLQCGEVRQSNYRAVCLHGQDTARYLRIQINKTFEGNAFLGAYPISATGAIRIQ